MDTTHVQGANPGVNPVANAMLDEHQAAEHLGVKVATLRSWRRAHKGPCFVRLGRLVRYRVADVEAFIEANTVRTCGEQVVCN